MNKLLGVLKWVAVYYGFMKIVNIIAMELILVTPDNVHTVNDTSGVIAVLLTLACFRIEKTEMVKEAPSKKSKWKRFFFILVTVGIAVFIYKRKKAMAWN